MNALIEDLNKNYKTLAEVARQNDARDVPYLSRKAKKLGLGKKVKNLLLFSPEDANKLIDSIQRREKEPQGQEN